MSTTSVDGELLHGDITGKIIGAFFTVYDELGYGFLEMVYRNAMAFELKQRGLDCPMEARVEVWYKQHKMGFYRADLFVDRKVIIEIKSTRALEQSDERQLRNLLKASKVEVGLLLHFGPKPAFHRIFFENSLKRAVPATSL